MPFNAAEYRIGQLYTIAKKSRLESADGKNGVRINKNEPYSNGPGGFGQYTNKTYYLANKMPDWLKRLLPESAGKLREEAWNAYPYSKNKFTNPLMDNKLTLEIESRYLDGPPSMGNVFDLSAKEERARRVELIDVVNDNYLGNRAKSEPATAADLRDVEYGQSALLAFDPLFRAPLTRDWLREYELAAHTSPPLHSTTMVTTTPRLQAGVNESFCAAADGDGDDDVDVDQGAKQIERQLMTCYKLCRVSFPVWPLQSKVEQFIQQYCRDTIIESHRQTWLWQDEWTGLSLADIRSMESDTQNHLSNLMCHETTLN